MRRSRYAIVFALALLAASALAGVAAAAPEDSAKLTRAVTVDGIMQHEREFQRIATANDNNRAAGTSGYNDSRRYVVDRLRRAGYEVQVHPFDFLLFEEITDPRMQRISPDPEVYAENEDFATMDYSGSGDVTDIVQPVDVVMPPTPESTSTSGCQDADFANFTRGNIALIQRGACDFVVKALNAQEAGASAVVIFNEGNANHPDRQDLLLGTLGETEDIDIPVVGTTFAVGQELYNLDQGDDVQLRVVTNTNIDPRSTTNVLANTPGGNQRQAVVVGAHLDSVDEGPGINDNGSGSSTILEIAEEMSQLKIEPRNQVRFAFWGAEESGLVGSTRYVNNLSNRQLSNIMVNLNFDMLGSPNFVRFVYDGNGSDTPDAGPDGSGKVERVFNNYFASRDLETEPTAFDGRSDYGPFIDVGIPAGGLFSGAEDEKTAEEAAIYGGTAGTPYDPCYHQACDNIQNLSATALNQLSDGAAHATYEFAMTRQPVGGSGAEAQSAREAGETSTYLGTRLQR